MEEERIRLFVGGLGRDVTAVEVQERLTPLGQVHNVTLVAAKDGPGHRGFAYADFVPATDASLRKLFSAYNGCKWRGGILRIEKAKEHFAELFQRERAADSAALAANDGRGSHQISKRSATRKESNRTNRQTMESDGVKIFIPSLGKPKALPLTGLGKHKRSFQRVESSPVHLLSTSDDNKHPGPPDCTPAKGSSKRPRSKLVNGSSEFAFDTTGISSRKTDVMDTDGIDISGTDGRELIGGGGENTSSKPSFAHVQEHFQKPEPHAYLSQRGGGESTLGKEDDLVICEMPDPKGTIKIVEEDDDESSSLLFAEERTKQLDLIQRLFPDNDLGTREVENVENVPEHGSKNTKRNRKREIHSNSADIEPLKETAESRTAEQFPLEQRSEEHQEMIAELDETPVYRTSKSNRRSLRQDERAKSIDKQSGNPRGDDPETVETRDGDSVGLASSELHDKRPLKRKSAMLVNDLSHEDPQKISDLGYSEEIAHPERQAPSSSEESISEDSEDGVTMALNMGNDMISLSTAEEQERRVLMGMLGVNTKSSRRTRRGVSQTKELAIKDASGLKNEDKRKDSDHEDDPLNQTVSGPTPPQAIESSPLEELARGARIGEFVKDEPLKQTVAADFPLSRENNESIEDSRIGSERNIMREAEGETDEDKISNVAQPVQEEKRKSRSRLQTNVDNSTGQKQDDPPGLTRATWKSLVGETGHVVFLLRDLAGSSTRDENLHTQETTSADDRHVQEERDFKSTSDRHVEQMSTLPHIHTIVESGNVWPPKQLEVKKTTELPLNLLTSADQCVFMKSENAEEEWLATKSQLRSDYRGKHKHAAKNVRKLWGKRT